MFTEAQELAYKAGLIRFYKEDKVVGAGFYVQKGYVLTCAHVVTQCLNLGSKPKEIAVDAVVDRPVKVDFPFVAREQFQNVEVVAALWRFNGQDLAVLKISDALPEGITPLSLPESSHYRDHRYHVYGFPDGHPDGVWTQGELLGELTNGWIQMEDTKAEGLAIEPGFSGAPVWDETRKAIAGMTVARDKDREDAKVGFMIPYQKLKPVLEAIALFDLLLPAIETINSHWHAAYNLLRPENSAETSAMTLQEAIVQLQDMPPRNSLYRAIDQFVGYLALPELGLQIQPSLLRWLTKSLQQADEKIEALLKTIREKKEIQQSTQSKLLTPHLLFWVQDESGSDRYFVQAYLVSDREQYDPLSATQLIAPAAFLEKSEDGKVDQSELEKILRSCLSESGQKLGDIRNLRIEVFLPLHHLDWAVDQWAVTEDSEPDLMGCRYQMVVRISHRWHKTYNQYQGDWDNKWKILNNLGNRQAHQGFICGDGQRLKKIRQHLRHADITGLILTQCLPTETEDRLSSFIALLHAGSPIALWPRRNFDDHSQQFKQLLVDCPSKFESLIAFTPDSFDAEVKQEDAQNPCNGLLGCNLSQLPERVRALRERIDQECDDGETHIGQHIGFIWEDPKLVPPIAAAAPRLRMSA